MLKRRSGWLSLLVAAVAVLFAIAWHSTPAYAQDASPDHGGNPGDGGTVVKGLLEAMPDGGGAGVYRVGGKDYTADADTEFEEEYGALAVNACVAVKTDRDTPTVAEKIATLPAAFCGGSGHPGDDDDIEFYGLVETMPVTGLVGVWVIDGQTLTATTSTTFEQDHGAFAEGVCVEAHAARSAPTMLTKLESESDYKCSGHDDDDDGRPEFHGRLFGAITSLPSDPNLLGVWAVGDITFTVTSTTTLVQERVPFTIGTFIKVKFYEQDGVKQATEVKSFYWPRHHHHGGDDHHEGWLGHAFGEVVTLPAGNLGVWNIAGISYTVTSTTRIVAFGDPIAVGTNVRVNYYTDASGARIAVKIKETADRGGINQGGVFKFVGFVETKPAAFWGTWTIGGGEFFADARTRFDETDGLLAVGAYVEVTYIIVQNQRVALKIDSEAAPGSGDDNSAGVIQAGGDNTLSAAAVDSGTTWRIGNRNYVVSSATELDDSAGALTLGSTALVNSYTAADGTQVATRIAGITLTNSTYLPVLQK